MNIICPGCALTFPVIAGINDAEARRVAELMGKIPRKIAAYTLIYINLFKPQKSGLTWPRVYTLLSQMEPDITAGQINRNGRIWIARVDHWYIALQEMIDRRHKLTLPIKSHGYLYEILAGLADKAEASVEKKHEQSLRGRGDTGKQSRTVADITGDLNHFKNMVEASSNPVVKEAMQIQVERCRTELDAVTGGK